MIPVASILSIAHGVLKGVGDWLNSAAGNMFKGWVKGRKDQQRIDTIKAQKVEAEQVTRIHERLQEHADAVLKERFEADARRPDDSPHLRVRGRKPDWKP